MGRYEVEVTLTSGEVVIARKIQQPRYRDNRVLIMKNSVRSGCYNYIIFTHDKERGMTGKLYRYLGDKVHHECADRIWVNPANPQQVCYEIPLDFLQEVAYSHIKGDLL